MGSQDSPVRGGYVEQLADHARRLQGEARRALAAGDYQRAARLIDDAELLAADVHNLVADLEHRQTDGLAAMALTEHAAAASRRRRAFFVLPSRRARMALGTSIAMSLALTEC